MPDPYKLVLFSIAASVIILLIVLFYQYIYPKKPMKLFPLLMLISIPPIVSIFRPGVYESGDFMIHLYRSIEFYQSLAEGNIFPSWAGRLNATYGYPLFIFNYPLPYYVISFFHLLGFSFIFSMKLFLATNFLLAGIFMYLCGKKLFKNDIAAFVTAIFYQFAPYHLIALHFKIVIGELLIFTFLPIVFFCLQKLWEKRTITWFCLASLSTALLIMSHVVLALFIMTLFFAYALFRCFQTKKKYFVFSTFFVLLLGSICSLYIWLTPFFLSKYTLFQKVDGFVYFPQILELLYAPWRFGFLFQGSQGELSFLLGYTQLLVIGILCFLLFKKLITKKDRPAIMFWIIVFFIIIFLISPYSKPIWGVVPFLKITGSHRLLILAAFVSALLAGYFGLYLLKRELLLFLLIVATIFSTILNWGHRHMHPEIREQKLIDTVWQSTSQIEGHFYANSRWRNPNAPWFDRLPKKHLESVKGKVEVEEISRTTTRHEYVINIKTDALIQESTLYFPGWKVFANEKEVQIKPDHQGRISFALEKGLYHVEAIYHDLLIYKILKIISAGTLGVTSICLLFSLRKRKRLF